jgi:hypothetical protein
MGRRLTKRGQSSREEGKKDDENLDDTMMSFNIWVVEVLSRCFSHTQHNQLI